MTQEEAIKVINGLRIPYIDEYSYNRNEALDMAIEALSEQVTSKLKNPCDSLLTDDSDERKEQKSKLDLISRADAIEEISKGVWNVHELIDRIKALPSARPTGETLQNLTKPNKTCEFDIISRADAIKAVANGIWHYPSEQYSNLNSYDMSEALAKDCLMSLPSARPTVDCTKFMEWLKTEALDEENWELNAIANGEIICRKFKKLGWLDVDDGFYVDATPAGEWIHDGYDHPHGIDWMHCSNCGRREPHVPAAMTNYCPSCGAKMEVEHE